MRVFLSDDGLTDVYDQSLRDRAYETLLPRAAATVVIWAVFAAILLLL